MEHYDIYARRFPNSNPFGYSNCYLNNDPRNNGPLTMAHIAGLDPRACPISGSNGSTRTRSVAIQEDNMPDNDSNPRRRSRTSLACARCRKRKIRCSGDPGNGLGCTSCRQAGVDMNACQFHRVGTTFIPGDNQLQYMLSGSPPTGLPNIVNPHTSMHIYNATGNSLYRIPPNQYPHQIDTKPTVYPQTWTIPNPEDTSPIETYNLDQHQPTTYMPNPVTMTSLYGPGHRWTYPHRTITNGPQSYMDQGPASYTSSSMPYMQAANLRPAPTTEPMSPLNMTSIQSALPISLPIRPYSQSEGTATRRQLPVPQPGPNTHNTVDLMQAQRLRSAQMMSGSQMNLNGTFVKPAMPWKPESSGSELQRTPSTEASSGESVTQNANTSPITDDGVMGFPSFKDSTPSIKESETPSAQPQPQLQFSTSTLLETMPVATTATTYSNFRNYGLPTSSSADSLTLLARQSSHNNLYSFSASNDAKRNSFSGSSNEASLVSGQRYTPNIFPPPTAPTRNRPTEAHHALESRHVPLHRASMSNLERNF